MVQILFSYYFLVVVVVVHHPFAIVKRCQTLIE
jgi:hypothetical protein